ncbi:MAG: tyrosine-type recombinase/integrase [Thermomicrobiales bacterium]|nr:tyrosine-type recombinase/integrase [Thermomicrobiales bacterium]
MTRQRTSSNDLVQQLSLFSAELPSAPPISEPEAIPVTPFSLLSVARVWFRQHLIDAARPANTVESYTYDLVVMEQRITDKAVKDITETDIALYLAEASSKVTRKRRLTSAKAFFAWLNNDLKVLKADPTASFAPHPLEHHLPNVLTANEQVALMRAAMDDEAWSAPAILLMMRLGLGRTELLALRRDHIDRTTTAGAEVMIAYDSPGKRGKQRTLVADAEFANSYAQYLEEKNPADLLFPFGPQAVNGMVDRVAGNAGIKRKITPQLLRHTAAVAMARDDTEVNSLLHKLGLVNDARNRETVRLYIAAAEDEA